MSPLRLLSVAMVFLLLAGCGQSTVVTRKPIERPTQRPHATRPVGPSYTVQRGDTLYGIAFRNKQDFKDIAAWNGIVSPYVIYPGQVLKLSPATGPQVASRFPTPPAPRPDPQGLAPTGKPNRTSGTVQRVATDSGTSGQSSPDPQPVTAPVAVSPARAENGSTEASTSTTPAVGTALSWRWPTAGDVVSRFVAGDPTRQGINIGGAAGQVVNAAADGVVVYSGAGLIGYGELVIVKHNDEFLSAYGHNRKRLVAEGESVRAGQPIAEMGRSGAARDMLHFEIRRKGKPVDPLAHLPRR